MLAAWCPALGPPEVVELTRMDPPTVEEGQVRVGVHAASVNLPDVLVVAGEYQIAVAPPFIPGSEFAGVVEEVAPSVEGLGVGDRVSGSTLVGAFAEEVVVPAASLTRVPDGLGWDLAAAYGVAHRTAYHVLRSVAEVRPGEELVVLGAGGGVGLAAVQLGRLLGATVTAVASTPEKRGVATEAGAARTVDARAEDLRSELRAALPEGADVVIDPVGGDLAEPALRSLRWGGRFVTVGYASGTIPRIPLNLVLLKGVRVLGFQFLDFATHAPELVARDESELMSHLAAGRVVPHVGATFPLEDTAAALRHVADGLSVGKTVIRVS